MLDSGTDLRNVLEVDSLNGEVVLVLFLLADDDSLGAVDALVGLESQEVLDFASLREKGITRPLSMTLTTMGKWE